MLNSEVAAHHTVGRHLAVQQRVTGLAVPPEA